MFQRHGRCLKWTAAVVLFVAFNAASPGTQDQPLTSGLNLPFGIAFYPRPVAVTVAKDGSLFVTEDGNGTIWRITYQGTPNTRR
jgi:glucose/arabinose dehydrogenase